MKEICEKYVFLLGYDDISQKDRKIVQEPQITKTPQKERGGFL
jgi:hypothetical protein